MEYPAGTPAGWGVSTDSAVTRPPPAVSESMTSNATAIRSGVSTTVVTAGT